MGSGQGQGQGTMQMDQIRTQSSNEQRIQQRDQRRIHQGTLNDQAKQSGSWKMLQQKTGMSGEQLEKLYAEHRVRNYGQFGMAMVASKNRNLDSSQLLGHMAKGNSLQKSLEIQGLTREEARLQIRTAQREMYQSESPAAD